MVSLACFFARDFKEALRTAQTAVHCYPNMPEGWMVLISVLCKNKMRGSNNIVFIQKVVRYVTNNLNISQRLLKWLEYIAITLST